MPSAFFLPVEPGERFCIYHAPADARARGAVVYVHPFAEEMNKSRRMAALQSRRLAAEGFSVLQIDLHGCGDSTGDSGDARWEGWLRDVKAAVHWLRGRVDAPISLWGLRLGAMLAAQVGSDPAMRIERLLLWQPVTNGARFLSQFLRLRLAGEMLATGAATSAIHELQSALAQGKSLEIAGYELHPELASAIEHLNPSGIVPAVKHVTWIEVVADAALPMRPASRRVLDAWQAGGVEASAVTVAGEPFWSTLEITECHDLLAVTNRSIASLD